MEQGTGEQFEVDIISICCDYSEDTLQEIIDNYSIDVDPEEDIPEQVQEYLQDNTTVIGVTGDGESIVYQVF
ncbi:hypothetical protein M316_0036 [Nitrincola phage 1M3-16]|uniref:hypothetical protein n=1 Tax=Nitrincola phage 1M3-16 TaxID=1472912 RepID=UPI000444CF85|nr:hypothetical protein GJ22_gp116 [Nitrincola phage 1M3-16]AHX01101.1 hypothetical protein M316_0036 [Nitrincola phage 1M3-16]